MEIILAVCAAFHSGSVSRWLSAAFGFVAENFDRRCSAFLGSPVAVSSRRSVANVPSVATSGCERWRRPWISRGTNRHWRRNFSHACPPFLSLGAYSTSRRSFGTIYLGELDCRSGRLLHKSPHDSFARLHSGSSSNYRRHHRIAFGKQALCCARNFALPRHSAGHCGNKVDLHDVKTPRCPGMFRKSAQRADPTLAAVSVRFPVTMGWLCNRMRRSHRRIESKAGKALRRPARGAQARNLPDCSPPIGTNVPPEASVCYALHATDVRNAFAGEQKRRRPGSSP